MFTKEAQKVIERILKKNYYLPNSSESEDFLKISVICLITFLPFSVYLHSFKMLAVKSVQLS